MDECNVNSIKGLNQSSLFFIFHSQQWERTLLIRLRKDTEKAAPTVVAAQAKQE